MRNLKEKIKNYITIEQLDSHSFLFRFYNQKLTQRKITIPYDGVCVGVLKENQRMTIKGLFGTFTRNIRRDLEEWLRDNNIFVVEYERRTTKGIRYVIVELDGHR